MDTYLRRIATDEIDETYALYLEVFSWLKEKGIRQWLVPISRETFCERQARGEIFALIKGDHICAIATVCQEPAKAWSTELPEPSRWWIKSLAVKRDFAGSKVGRLMMQECEKRIAGHGGKELFLDCVAGSMLDCFYSSLGYKTIARKPVPVTDGESFDMVLMQKDLSTKPSLVKSVPVAITV